MQSYIFGVDIGGTSIKIGLFDRLGTLLEKRSIETDVRDGGMNIIGDLVKALRTFDVEASLVEGIGIGVPGPVKDGIVGQAVNLGWKNYDVGAVMSAGWGLPVKIAIHNDANLAALGEQVAGAAQDVKNLVFFTLGTGVGGGIVSDGKIIEGAHGAGGEIGHMLVGDKGFACACGNRDCLETIASASGIKRLAEHYVNHTAMPSRLRQESYYSAKYIFDLAMADDLLAVAIIEDVTDTLARAAQILSVVIDPEAFVFGGGVSRAGDFLIDKIREKYQRIAFPTLRDIRFVTAHLGNDAGIYGAYKAVRDAD
ncbi:MAG: ROK family protein [Acholeplasmatales bacterium]|nr:MAG: ROK family protein [Acholeplasmatales bacterium]